MWSPKIICLLTASSPKKSRAKSHHGGRFFALFLLVSDLIYCRNLLCSSNRLDMVHEAIYYVGLQLSDLELSGRQNSDTKTHSSLPNEVQILSHLWINSGMKKCSALRWMVHRPYSGMSLVILCLILGT